MAELAPPYRLLVTGSRAWRDIRLIRSVLAGVLREHPGAVLVSGHCERGADAIAENCWAALCGFETVDEAVEAGRIELYPADWERHGKRAGPLRNSAMVATAPDECVAFIGDASPGATHCSAAAEAAGIPVRRWRQ